MSLEDRAVGFLRRYDVAAHPSLRYQVALALITEREFPQMVIEPSHGHLNDLMQCPERQRGRNVNLTPDQRRGIRQFDTHGCDFVEAMECCHAARIADPTFQCQGRSSWGRGLGSIW